MINSIIKPKRPSGSGWVQNAKPPSWVSLGYECEAWQYKNICVLSSVEVAKDADNIDRGPEYHISISMREKNQLIRCDSKTAEWVIKEFNCEGAEEDNHAPHGMVRNFWRPVADNLVGLECACKDDEPAIKEDKGDYVWRGAK